MNCKLKLSDQIISLLLVKTIGLSDIGKNDSRPNANNIPI